jgi:hypothetical protein
MTRPAHSELEHADAVTKAIDDQAQARVQMVLNIVTITGSCRE